MTVWERNPASRVLAAALIAMLVQGWTLPATAAPATGSIAGVIKSDEGGKPLVGAIVHIAARDGGAVHSSKPSTADGGFIVDGLPAGEYEIGVESDGGLFLVYVPLKITDARAKRIELVVTGSAEAAALVGAGRKAGSAGAWSNPLTAALIVVGGAVVVGAVVSATDDDDERGASTFN